jgi:2-C-methyl-D-erythritol 2,4-cyclodiphosphate synthase
LVFCGQVLRVIIVDEILEEQDCLRVGIGYDVHRFANGRKLIIGGVLIPHSLGLLGHSDADVLLHAICDALLGAASLGDIGVHFPDTDHRYRDADSRTLLRSVVTRIQQQRYQVQNVDAVIIAEAPKMAPHIPAMIANIATDLGVPEHCVNVKATTTEGLGAIGRGEGIAAQAICCVQKRR